MGLSERFSIGLKSRRRVDSANIIAYHSCEAFLFGAIIDEPLTKQECVPKHVSLARAVVTLNFSSLMLYKAKSYIHAKKIQKVIQIKISKSLSWIGNYSNTGNMQSDIA